MKRLNLAPSSAPETYGRDEPTRPCKRGCCWTPYGHSTARDGYMKSHRNACNCHDSQTTTVTNVTLEDLMNGENE